MGVTLLIRPDLAKAGKIAGMDADARQEQLEAQQNVQRALLNFEEAIQKIRNKIFNRNYLIVAYLISLQRLWVSYKTNLQIL